MNVESILAGIQEKANGMDPLGATMKMAIDDMIVYIDGSGDSNVVSQEDKDADCVISTSVDTLQKLMSGDLNGMMAVMTGKVKIKGDMGVAMKLQNLLG